MQFYASKGYILERGNPKTLEQATDHRFIFSVGNRVLNSIGEKRISVSPVLVSSNIECAYRLCLMGYGILELPTIFYGVSALERVLKDLPTFKNSLYLVALIEEKRTLAASLFFHFAKKYFEKCQE